MSISSSANAEEKREEAIKLFISAVQFPPGFPTYGENIAGEIIKGAELLLDYIKSGKIAKPD
jgi:hypothetical protein